MARRLIGTASISQFITDLLYSAIEWIGYHAFGSKISRRTQKFVLQLAVAASLFIFLLFVAVILYGLFYWNYIPQVSHSLPVFFDFGSDGSDSETLPVAYIPLRQLGTDYRILSNGQLYDITLRMHLPESNSNLDLSNFMVELLGKDSHNNTVNISKRPALLSHKTPLARYITTMWRILPLLLGFFPEKQYLELPLLQNFIESGTDWFLIRLSSSKVQVYSAFLQVDAHFQGLRFFMYYWFFTTASVIISIILFWETLAAFILFKLAQSLHKQKTQHAGGIQMSSSSSFGDKSQDTSHTDTDAYSTAATARQVRPQVSTWSGGDETHVSRSDSGSSIDSVYAEGATSSVSVALKSHQSGLTKRRSNNTIRSPSNSEDYTDCLQPATF